MTVQQFAKAFTTLVLGIYLFIFTVMIAVVSSYANIRLACNT